MSLLLREARLGEEIVDVLIEDDVISSVSKSYGSIASEEVALDGRWLVPGLWDNHVHFNQWSMMRQRLNLSDATSAREAAAMVGSALASNGGRVLPFVGFGFRDGLWPDAPNLQDLDAASYGHPVVLVSGDLHSVWLNSAALDSYGHTGHLSGLLREEQAFDITGRINTVAPDVLDSWAETAARQAARRGVVGIVDLEMDWNLQSWMRRMAAGSRSLRVEFGVYTQHLDRAIQIGLRTGQRINELLTVGPYKVITDGSLNTRTAFCYDEYPGLRGDPHPHGLLTVPPAQLLPLMRRAVAAGLDPAVHAIGDQASTLALDAFEALGSGGRLEHAQLLADEDVPRFARLGVTASVQPEHAMDDRDMADTFWAGRTGRSFALRSLLEAGAQLALGSDAPVAPLDPWVTVAAAVGRSRDGREPWHPEQSITSEAALGASTRTTISVGQPADLAILDENPHTATHGTLRTMPVAATLLAGNFTHRQV